MLAGGGLQLQIPRTDVGVGAFAIRLTIRAQTVNIDFAFDTWVEIEIRTFPGVTWQAIEIAAGFPVGRQRIRGRFDRQRHQTLIGRRVGHVIEPVELQLLHEYRDIRFGGSDSRGIGSIKNFGYDDRCQNAENHHDDHDFDEGKAAIFFHGEILDGGLWKCRKAFWYLFNTCICDYPLSPSPSVPLPRGEREV